MFRDTEGRTGPYIQANFNPDSQHFGEMLRRSSFSILDVGCGEKPRLSWALSAGDLWVGCDPAATNGIVIKGERPVRQSAGLVVFPYTADEIPLFKPDVISVIAPNQEDIVKGRVFNDGLEKLLDPGKEQTMVVLLDTRTHESQTFQEEAKHFISRWRRENGFKPDAENPVLDKFRLNSADAGAKNIRFCYIRNSSR
ncbi:MAG: hypothetical protein ABSE04_04140 [Candidatus Microgenomates bacterium]|jgi:hypothetical protein